MKCQSPRYWSVRSHLIVIVAALGLCMVAWAVYVNGTLERVRRDQAVETVRQLGEKVAERHRAISLQTRQMLFTLAHNEAVRSLDPERTSALLAEVHGGLPEYATLVAASPQGLVYACSIPAELPIDIRERHWFKRLMASKNFVVDEFIVSKSAGTASLPYAYPVLDDRGEVRTILGAALKLSSFASLFADAVPAADSTLLLIDHAGRVLFAGGAAPGLIGKEAREVLPADLAAAGPGIHRGVDGKGVSILYVVEPVMAGQDENRFTLVVGIPEANLYAGSRRQFAVNMAALAGLVLLSAFLLFLYGRRYLSAPLNDLVRATREVSSGNLAARTSPSSNLAEFGLLAREVDAMITSLEAEDRSRRLHEKALRESEERFRTLVENAADAIYLADMEGRLLDVNFEAERQTGFSRDELLGMHIRDLDVSVPPEALAVFAGEIPKRRLLTIDTAHRRKDGSAFPVEVRAVYLDSGDEPMILGVARDISERRQAEDRLREAEQHFRTLANGGSALIWTAGLDKLCNYFNEPWLRFTGRALEQELGNGWAQGVHPDDFDSCLATYVSSFDRREAFVMDYRLRHRDGEYRWIRDFGNPRYDSSGEFLGYIGFCYDITESRRVEEALSRKDAMLQAMLRNLPFDFWARDCDQRIIMQSDESIRLWGDLSVGAEIEEKVDSKSREVWRENNRRVLAGEILTGERELVVAGGERRIFHETVAPIRDGDSLLGILGVNIDITERKRGESEREKLRQQILQAQKMESIGRLAGGVAHDFNNMLGVILGHVELAMEQTAPGEPIHADLQEIRAAGQRSADLTRQLLAFARRQTAAPRVLALNDTIEGMLKMLRRLIGEEIELVWRPGGGLWPIRMDPSQIDQILVNLCVNSRDAIGGIGRIAIETANIALAGGPLIVDAVQGEFVQLTLSDTGAGMDSEVLENIFEPFFTTKEVGAGTGLGLATVYGIVRQNNGMIKVDSAPGRGSVFTIYLPRYLGETDRQGSPGPDGPGRQDRGRGETVLLVEDEPLILHMAKRMLESLGFSVLAASSPAEALETATGFAGDIRLLLTDVVMPDMSGRDLAERIAAIRPGLCCLFMSGYTADVIADHGLLDKGTCFIPKPFSKAELATKISEVLAGHRG